MPRLNTLEICQKYFFTDSVNVPAAYQERIKRIRTGYVQWYEYPTSSEISIRDYLMKEFNISKSSAYEDIQAIKVLFGNIQNPAKNWVRFQINTMLDESFELAKKNKDSKGMSMAAGNKAKYNMLHIPDSEPLPFDQIAVQPFEPTDDPTPLGLKKDPDIRQKKIKMLQKYQADIEIVDVAYEQLINDQGLDFEEEPGNIFEN